MNYEDEIYNSGYLDGYYASMELYHSDDSEMTEEEKAKARRKRRIRNIALGVAGAAALGVGGYAYKKLEPDYAEMDRSMDDFDNWSKTVRNTMRKSAPKPKRKVAGFRRNVSGTYKWPSSRTYVPTWALERARKHPNTKYWNKN